MRKLIQFPFPVLGIATQGKTEEEVKDNIKDLIKEYLKDPDTPCGFKFHPGTI